MISCHISETDENISMQVILRYKIYTYSVLEDYLNIPASFWLNIPTFLIERVYIELLFTPCPNIRGEKRIN